MLVAVLILYYVAVCPHYRNDDGGGKPVNGFVGQSATGPTHGMHHASSLQPGNRC